MTTQEIAEKLITLCKEAKDVQAVQELYADDAVSYEPDGMQNAVSTGKEAILKHTQDFLDSVETMYGSYISEPLVAGDVFTCTMGFDAEIKGFGRMKVDEAAVYEVTDGKISAARFFYKM